MKLLKNILVSMLVLIGISSCIKEDKPVQSDLKTGDMIPDFTVQMNDGSVVTGEMLRRGTALIMFFNTGCPDCQKTLPSVQDVYDEFGREVKFALISREQGDEEIAPYWESQGYSIPYSAQTDRNVYHLFASSRVPRVYICKDGIIKAIYIDQPQNPTFDQLSAALNSL